MKKIILSLTLSIMLNANTVFMNPLSVLDRSIDNGGSSMSALQSYQDGVGAILLDPLSGSIPTNNSAMNTLVFTYGDSAQTNNSTIVNEVLSNTVNPPLADIKLANQLLVQTAAAAHTNGTLCDDGDSATHGETWINDICQGGASNVYLNGSICNDGNPASTGETWLNDVCQGGGIVNVYPNGSSCSDGNAATIGEAWLNDICQGGVRVASGTFIEWPKFNTPNGTCSGTFKGDHSMNTVSYYKTLINIKSPVGSGLGSDCFALSEVILSGYSYGWYPSTKDLSSPSCINGTLVRVFPYYYNTNPSMVPYKTYRGTVYDRLTNPYACAICKSGSIYNMTTKGCVAQ